MSDALDLDAYLARLEFAGPVRADLDTLVRLVRAHVRRVPFENLDVLLGRGVALDLDALQRKLVTARRGGYCFEHATLVGAALDAIGFVALRHSARVVLFSPRAQSPRTHMFLTVALPEGRFVVDAGFGSLASEVPIPLADSGAAPPSGAAHWMVRDRAGWTLRARSEGEDVDCWVTTLEADNPIDFAVANHYVATHPDSAFRQRLMLRAITPDGRVSVMNRDVTWRTAGGARTARLGDRAALRALLREHFGFDLPEAETLTVPTVDEWA
jgi:N-hydroxyarylamine O-acetyltransferase